MTSKNYLRTPKLSGKTKKARREYLTKSVHQLRLNNTITAADLVEQMAGMSIQARNIGLCAQIYQKMLTDQKRPTIMLGLAGPLIAAGLRKVISDMIANNLVDVVVSTGAIIYQDIYQARGFQHYHGTPDADDVRLHDLKIDRIYDTYVDEAKFLETDAWCGKIADRLPPGNYSSRQYLDHLAGYIDDKNSIVYQAKKHNVPIFCPALNDSSIGIGLTNHRVECLQKKQPGIAIDSIMDNHELTQIVVQSPSTAAVYVAGGVPKNYINDSVIMSYIYGLDRGHDYAIQLTTAVTQDGGLSGSTLSEARSWGKIEADANFALAWVEPSVSLPLVVSSVLAKNSAKGRSRLKYEWSGEILRKLTV